MDPRKNARISRYPLENSVWLMKALPYRRSVGYQILNHLSYQVSYQVIIGVLEYGIWHLDLWIVEVEMAMMIGVVLDGT